MKSNFVRYSIPLLVGIMIWLIVSLVSGDSANSFFVAILVAGIVYHRSFKKKVPADPPHRGILTIGGERTNEVTKEGWDLFPFCPYLYDAIPVNIENVEQDIEVEVRTPDLAPLKVVIGVTWTPDYEIAGGLINYLNSGGEAGVKKILEDVIKERVREWAKSSTEGPKTWDEAIGAHGDASAILLKAILGEDLPRINSKIPTNTLIHFLDGKQSTDIEKEQWGDGTDEWGKLRKRFSSDYPERSESRAKLDSQIRQRKEEIQSVRAGNGKHHKTRYGIMLNRINIEDIIPLGKLAEDAALQSREIQQRRGEVFEVGTVTLMAEELIKAVERANEKIPDANAKQKLSFEDAYKIVSDYKMTQGGNGFVIPGLAPAIISIAETFLGVKKGVTA